MTTLEPAAFEIGPSTTRQWPSAPTWRYLGDRDAADLAYCARFGTREAPEPAVGPGNTWAYALPPTDKATGAPERKATFSKEAV